MAVRNLKRRNDEVWVDAEALGVRPPEIEFYTDATLSEPLKSLGFDLVERGSVAERTVWLKNMSKNSIYNLQLEAHAEPDKKWAEGKGAGPLHLQVEPERITELQAGHAAAIKVTWRSASDEPLGDKRASIFGTAQFLEE